MRLRSIIFAGLFLLSAGAGLFIDGQTARRRVTTAAATEPSFVRITQQEIAILLEGIGAANPRILQGLADSPELRQAQLENFKHLLALAQQAQKEGLAALPLHARELKSIRDETIAVNYDYHLNKDTAATPFSLISDEQVQNYFGEAPGSKMSTSLKSARSRGFQDFFDTKLALIGSGDPQMKDRVITEEERQQARDLYAKINIYADEYKKKSPLLPRSLHDKANLQVKLQQAQFLARLYSEKLAPRVAVSDEEIANFIKAHPEYDITAKRAKANEILVRAKSGEDFAELADEFSEDPGNVSPQGDSQGGLYKNVKKGVMVPAFEHAALALDAGQISAGLVESDFGFHIIKLERKGKSSGPDAVETYDVRHILFATSVQRADGRFESIEENVRNTLEREKEERIVGELARANNISVPADFTVPGVPAADEPAKMAAPVRRKARATRKRN